MQRTHALVHIYIYQVRIHTPGSTQCCHVLPLLLLCYLLCTTRCCYRRSAFHGGALIYFPPRSCCVARTTPHLLDLLSLFPLSPSPPFSFPFLLANPVVPASYNLLAIMPKFSCRLCARMLPLEKPLLLSGDCLRRYSCRIQPRSWADWISRYYSFCWASVKRQHSFVSLLLLCQAELVAQAKIAGNNLNNKAREGHWLLFLKVIHLLVRRCDFMPCVHWHLMNGY